MMKPYLKKILMSRISGRKCPSVMEENAPIMKHIYPCNYEKELLSQGDSKDVIF